MNSVTLRYKHASKLLIFNCTLNTEITKRRDFPGSPVLRISRVAQVPGWGTINKIPQAAQHGGKKKKEEFVDFITWLTL